jgi:hypothetical protein
LKIIDRFVRKLGKEEVMTDLSAAKWTYVRPFATARYYPISYKVFVACTLSYVLTSAFMFFGPVLEPAFYEKWLLIAHPFDELVGRYVPAINFATESLVNKHGQGLVAPVRNCLAINFFLLVFISVFGVIAPFIDVAKNGHWIREQVWSRYNNAVQMMDICCLRFPVCIIPIYGLFYFGPAIDPYNLSFQINVAYYCVEFGALTLMALSAELFWALKTVRASETRQS